MKETTRSIPELGLVAATRAIFSRPPSTPRLGYDGRPSLHPRSLRAPLSPGRNGRR
jgi:hypothetical protein